MEQEMRLYFDARAENEGLARVVVSAFAVRRNPTLDVLTDIKTAVSEAVTNAIVHGYKNVGGEVLVHCRLAENDMLEVTVSDEGCGITDIEQAMQPFFSTGEEGERSGMGFSVMKTFMDDVDVQSLPGRGTSVRMRKCLRGDNE